MTSHDAIVLLSNSSSVPLLMVIFSIIVVLLLRILHAPIYVAFGSAGLCLILALLGSIFLENAEPNISGISVSPISHLGFQILLPSFMAIVLLVLLNSESDQRKIDSLLLLLISFLGGMACMVSANWIMFFVGIQC